MLRQWLRLRVKPVQSHWLLQCMCMFFTHCTHPALLAACLLGVLQLVSSDLVAPFGVDSIRVCSNFMFVGMSREDEGIVKVYNLAAAGASHQLTGHKVGWGVAGNRGLVAVLSSGVVAGGSRQCLACSNCSQLEVFFFVQIALKSHQSQR